MIVLEDELFGDARWSKLAEQFPEPRARLTDAQHAVREDTLQAAYVRLFLYVGHQRDDGYLGHREALNLCRGKEWVLTALTTPTRGKGPFIHREGETCGRKNCIDASPPWVTGFEYRICAFWKKNASRKEKDRHESQKAELRDSALRDHVYKRDGGCCRYCRSGPMKRKGMGNASDHRRIPNIDHIDPDQLAGPDYAGVALSCKRCNTTKGARTPDQADMVLPPGPTPDQVAHWQDRGEARFDYLSEPGAHPADVVPDQWLNERLDNRADNPPDNTINNAQATRSAVGDPTAATVVPSADHDTTSASTGDPVSAGGPQDSGADITPEVSRSGRVGPPLPDPNLGALGQPVRHPSAPDIWTRQSRAPAAQPAPTRHPRAGGDSRAP